MLHGCSMNPHAEALKKRAFNFALRVVYFCRALRKTWEGAEFADQIFRAGTRVGANYRAACRGRSHDDFVAKLGHVVEELSLIHISEPTRLLSTSYAGCCLKK